MNLEKTSAMLKKIGYSPFLQKKLATLFCGIDDIKGNTVLDSIFQVRIESNKIICSFFDRSLEVQKQFDNEEQLFDFIKKQFPIENNK
jgi:hypothetical protein